MANEELRMEFCDKLEELFHKYHSVLYQIDSVWEMKNTIQAEVFLFKK
jgi:hypothetical protein